VATKVLQIPISRHGGEDFLSWPHIRFGVYTVKSAYHLAKSESALVARSAKGRGMVSNTAAEEQFWKALWKVVAPGKMRITLWRFAHNCLPSGDQLQRRQIPASPACIHCSVQESVEHAMLFCPVAREIWSEVKKGYDVHLNRRGFTSPKAWLAEFLANNGATQATILAVTFWHIWDARNKLREEGGSINPLSIALKIKAYVELILTHLYKPIPAHRRETSRAISWSPPPDGMLQLNVDAALFSSSSRMGAGVVARDDMGEFVACIGTVPLMSSAPSWLRRWRSDWLSHGQGVKASIVSLLPLIAFRWCNESIPRTGIVLLVEL
jgi:hypothetical protein